MKHVQTIAAAFAAAAVAAGTEPTPVDPIRVEIPQIAPITVAVPRIEIPQAAPLAVETPDARLDAAARELRPMLPLVRDARSFAESAADPAFAAWSKIYQDKSYIDYRPEYKPLAPGLRIINEIRAPRGSDEFLTLQKRLAFYKARGYNAALVTFDTSESLVWLSIAADYAKQEGFKLVLAYAGKENLKEPVWRDPEVLRSWLATLGAKADALLLGWRRTSPHLFLPDQTFSNFLIRSARERNMELPFVGVAYYGETAETREAVTYCVPEGAGAVLVVGLGYPRASTKRALRELFPEVAGHPHLIGLAVGERPYFDSQHANGRSRSENEAIKRRIELRLLAAGCKSTMTYSGDGSDGAYGDESKTENLCQEYGR